ncbi:hypothetical protein TNCT_328691 [Trichonephila clavata]|uniref:Uncharacterized protein n=1 Tax=Trichonephila clavata TaxID=2740835 RepID=A0A8X6I9W7_TRICU|nr:hypothetical protein TNCT_328691 [Trichonephila clavata]
MPRVVSGGVGVTTNPPPSHGGGWRTVRSADAKLFPLLGEIRKTIPNPPTRVVRERSSCRDNPTAGWKRWRQRTVCSRRAVVPMLRLSARCGVWRGDCHL